MMEMKYSTIRGEVGGHAFLLIITFAFLWLCCGCSDVTLEQQAERSERDLASLKRGAEKIRQSAMESKKSLGEQLVKVDEIIAKVDALLGKNPEVVIPPKPKPDAPNPIKPLPEPDSLPQPEPTPNPVPLPSPVIPEGPKDGRFEVARAIWKMAKDIQSPDLFKECQALGNGFASIAAELARLHELDSKKVAGSKLNSDEKKEFDRLNNKLGPGLFGDNGKEREDIVMGVKPQWMKISEELTKLNRPIIEKHLSAWEGPADKMGKAIAKFYKDGKLSNNMDWSDLFAEIADGLRAVKP